MQEWLLVSSISNERPQVTSAIFPSKINQTRFCWWVAKWSTTLKKHKNRMETLLKLSIVQAKLSETKLCPCPKVKENDEICCERPQKQSVLIRFENSFGGTKIVKYLNWQSLHTLVCRTDAWRLQKGRVNCFFLENYFRQSQLFLSEFIEFQPKDVKITPLMTKLGQYPIGWRMEQNIRFFLSFYFTLTQLKAAQFSQIPTTVSSGRLILEQNL